MRLQCPFSSQFATSIDTMSNLPFPSWAEQPTLFKLPYADTETPRMVSELSTTPFFPSTEAN